MAFSVFFSFLPMDVLLKGDISRFFILLYNFLLCVGFYVFIKNSVHFPQCSVLKRIIITIFVKRVRSGNKISTRLLPLN